MLHLLRVVLWLDRTCSALPELLGWRYVAFVLLLLLLISLAANIRFLLLLEAL